MMNTLRREDGQSIILIVILLAVLLGLVAVVLDIGNAYAQRRVSQNAADAAALAATRVLGPGAAFTTSRKVLQKAKEYAEMNGTDPESVVAWYISFDPDTQEYGPTPPPSYRTRRPAPRRGLRVSRCGREKDSALSWLKSSGVTS